MSIHPVLVVSDIHFPIHHERGWAAVKQFAVDVKPERVIAAGDIVESFKSRSASLKTKAENEALEETGRNYA